jgi:hypothetical protein
MLSILETSAGAVEPDARLWRFMDFTKYVSMLHRGALFFTRADLLPDQFEGFYSPGHRRPRRPGWLEERQSLRELVCLSSWHRNEHESAAMWRIYLSSGEGVALRSTAARLRVGFAATPETVQLGVVRYVDYERERVAEGGELDAFFCKRKSFDYEREVRLAWRADLALDEPGRYLRADLESLIETVVISPAGEPWFEELVRSVTEKYGFRLPVAPSNMNELPF